MEASIKNKIEKRVKNWYLTLITGILFIGIGIWVMATPIGAFLTLAWLFSFGFIFSGITDIIYSITNRKTIKSWGWLLVLGILTFLIGFHLMLRPGLTALVLCYYIGFWLLFRSIMHIGNAIELKDQGVKNWLWILVLGILGIVFSFILLWNPTVTSIATSFWLGFGFIALGLLQIVLGFGLRKIKKKVSTFKQRLKDKQYADYEIMDED